MSTISYGDFKSKIRKIIWPFPGEAKSLVDCHNSYFDQAMIELGQWVDPCLRQNHTSVFPADCTYVDCGMTVLNAPVGIIKRLYTIANSGWCFAAGTMVETSRGSVAIEKIKTGDSVLTRNGYRDVMWSGMTRKKASIMKVSFSDGSWFNATPDHPVWTLSGWKRVDELDALDIVLSCRTTQLCSTEKTTEGTQVPQRHRIEGTIDQKQVRFTETYGNPISDQFSQDLSFTTKTGTSSITAYKILSAYRTENTPGVTSNRHRFQNTHASSAEGHSRVTPATTKQSSAQDIVAQNQECSLGLMTLMHRVGTAERISGLTNTTSEHFAHVAVLGVTESGNEDVYDISVDGSHEFFANGILVHNCNKVFYRSSNYNKLTCVAKNLLLTWTPPDTTVIQQGIQKPSSSTDSTIGRSRVGWWAINRKRLYIVPWIQSNESVVVEWDGWKKEWSDSDTLDQDYWDAPAEDAVEAYVRWKHELNHTGNLIQARVYEEEYKDSLANLMFWCKEQIREQIDDACESDRAATEDELEAEEIPAEDTSETNFACVSDFGWTSTNSDTIAEMIDGWSPSYIITAGDNYQGDLSSDLEAGLEAYDTYVGARYGDYITDDLLTNKFWPAMGNHDWHGGGTPESEVWENYFTLPGNERYYTFRRGPVQFFMLDPYVAEPDGVISGSIQAEWLRVMLAASDAKWKIVVTHYPPYTGATGSAPGSLAARWDYEDWGADLVLSGHEHCYERHEVNGFPYIVCPSGGYDLDPGPPADIESEEDGIVTKALGYGFYGAFKMSATCDTLNMKLYNISGTLLDDITLTKDSDDKVTITAVTDPSLEP